MWFAKYISKLLEEVLVKLFDLITPLMFLFMLSDIYKF